MRLLLLLLFALLQGSLAWGSEGSDAVALMARPAVRSYGQRDGLPHHTIHALTRDPMGRLWAATENGAAYYCGRRWIPFLLPEESPSQFIRHILFTEDGSQWFATHEAGIWRYQKEQWTHFGKDEGLPSERIHHLLEFKNLPGCEGLWAATAGGPARWDGAKWVPLLKGLGKPWSWRLCVAKGPEGVQSLWTCQRGGLFRLQGERWQEVSAFRDMEINDFLELPEPVGGSRLWVSCWGRGPAYWNGTSWTFSAARLGFPGRYPTCLSWTRDPKGTLALWVGTYESGLARFMGQAWEVFTSDRGLRSNGVYALFPDPNGKPTLWLGMLGGGVTALNMDGWRTLNLRRIGLESTDVLSLQETLVGESRTLWFGSRAGVTSWDGRRWQVETGFPGGEVLAMAVAHERGVDRVYAGTPQGLVVREGGRWQSVPGVPKEPVQTLLGVGPSLFISSSSGLYRLQGGLLQQIPPPGFQQAPAILSLAQTLDTQGKPTLWAGTRGQGLLRYRDGQWDRLDPMPKHAAINWIMSLRASRKPDGQSVLWVGTRGNGLARLEESPAANSWTLFDARSRVPLPNCMVRQIQEDAQGRLYLGTSSGILRLSFTAKGEKLAGVESFTTADGLPSAVASPGASLVDHLGRVWFGFTDGAAYLDQRDELRPGNLPLPLVDRVTAPDCPTGLPGNGVLRHWQNQLSVDLFIPFYFREEDLRFKTQLLGLEDTPGPWRYETSRDYGGLRPGAYTLRVWAQDYLGRVAGPTELPFRIKPAPWAHPLALGAYLFLAAGGLALAFHLRTRMLSRQNRWLAREVREATAEIRDNQTELLRLNEELRYLNEEKNQFLGIAAHDLKNPLQGILISADRLSLLGDATTQAIATGIQRSVQAMVNLIERLLDISAIESGEVKAPLQCVALAPILTFLRDRHQEAAVRKGLSLVLEAFEPSLELRTHPEILTEVLDNLVSNALKFSPPGPPSLEVRVGAFEEGDKVCIWVQDQGPGFTAEDRQHTFRRFQKLSARPTAGEGSTGLGLSIVRKLVERLQGRIELVSEPGQGAKFMLWLPGKNGPLNPSVELPTDS